MPIPPAMMVAVPEVSTNDSRLVVALSQLAARVQRGRTQRDVLQCAGDGLMELGMRFAAFEIDSEEIVLRHVSTSPLRIQAIESVLGRPLVGLRAPLAPCTPAAEVVECREIIYRQDLDIFERFLHAARGIDLTPINQVPQTDGIPNGVVAPVLVREHPWGIVTVVSHEFRPTDAAAVALFAMLLGSALEVADFIETLARSQRELVERERLAALGELAAIVAHEVRNPLGAMFNCVSQLQRIVRGRGSDAEKLISIVDEEAKHLNSIVSDLLDFARPTSLRLTPTSLVDILTQVASSALSRGELSPIQVKLDLNDDLPSIRVDGRLMRQAILNIVLNGIQAMTAGGVLTVRARTEHAHDRRYVCVDVVDTGPGIRTEDRLRVFEPFFTTKPSGTGLGLPLVKRVVDAHQGDVDIVSSSEGTTVTIRIPIQPKQVASITS
jgi:signal transduction histidine kinase